jgi:DNA-binding transcriptional ArsR family regulator
VAKHRGRRLGVRSGIEADAFRWRALGKSTWRVYDAAKRSESASIDKLISALGMRQRQVRYHLRKLLAENLVHSGARGFQCDEAKSVLVAAKLGTLGMGAVQRAHHEQERRAYRQPRLRAVILRLAGEQGWPLLPVPPTTIVITRGEQTWHAFVLHADQQILGRVLRALLRRGRRTARNGTGQSRAGRAER